MMKRFIRIFFLSAFALAVSFLLWGIVSKLRSRGPTKPPAPVEAKSNRSREDGRRTPVAELHVLSTRMMDENVMNLAGGRKKESDVKILLPPNSQYTQAVAKPGKQAVLQLSVKFEADGSISDITPLAIRSLCGICLLPDDEAKAISPDLPKTRKRDGIEVVGIDPTLPQSRDLVEAAVEAVKQISFIPFQSEGRPMATHGLVECVFRLD
jgi:hypothetical protein